MWLWCICVLVIWLCSLAIWQTSIYASLAPAPANGNTNTLQHILLMFMVKRTSTCHTIEKWIAKIVIRKNEIVKIYMLSPTFSNKPYVFCWNSIRQVLFQINNGFFPSLRLVSYGVNDSRRFCLFIKILFLFVCQSIFAYIHLVDTWN